MGTQFIWSLAQMTMYWVGILDEEKTDLTLPQFNWNYRRRTPAEEQVQFPWSTLWPTSKFIGGGGASGTVYVAGQDIANGAMFEGWSVFNGGAYRPSYVQGQVTMADGVTGLGGAEVALYLQSTNALVSSGFTDANGYYSLPTPYAGTNHFIYANYNSGQYVGGSVDTLQPNA